MTTTSSGPSPAGGGPTRATPERLSFLTRTGQGISALRWGTGEPRLLFLHGRGQNAHTWDRVARSLALPALAIDLPGHGHSDWREDHDYGPWPNADAVAEVIGQTGEAPLLVVGMSLGGMSAVRLAARYGEQVERLVVIDTTPANLQRQKDLDASQRGAAALLTGPTAFDSLEDMVSATARTVPGRSVESLTRGVERNARQRADGRWTWRWDQEQSSGGDTPRNRDLLWDDVAALRCPVMLVHGEKSGRVRPEDIVRFAQAQSGLRVELVTGAGHSVQSDQPARLVTLLADFFGLTSGPDHNDAPHRDDGQYASPAD